MARAPARRSAVCPDCRRLVAAGADSCHGCGRRLGRGAVSIELGRLRFAPFVLWGCGALYLASLLWHPERLLEVPGQLARGQIFALLVPGREPLFLLGMSGAVPVFELGRWWTVLSASWLHGSLLHIVFNLMWIHNLAPAAARIFGPGRLVIIYTVAGVAGFSLTSTAALLALPPALSGAQFTVGASAPLFGLFGALVLYGQKSGNRELSLHFLQFVAIWVVIGVAASAGGPNAIRIDNWAHLGGFAGGYLAAVWLDPRRPERPWHLLAAGACLALTALAIIASLVLGLKMMP